MTALGLQTVLQKQPGSAWGIASSSGIARGRGKGMRTVEESWYGPHRTQQRLQAAAHSLLGPVEGIYGRQLVAGSQR